MLLVFAGAFATAASAKVSYRQLARVGVSAKNATLSDRRVRVRISTKRSVEVRLAVLRSRGRTLQGWAAFRLKPGAHMVTRRLARDPPAGRLKLRVTARSGRTRARRDMTLKRVGPSPPTQGSSVLSAIALSGSSVAENSPPGTAVGTLSAVGASPGAAPAFSLVPGPGSADNASFAIDGRIVTTAAALDFEAGASRSIRVRVSDGSGGAFEMPLTIAVTNANDAPSSIALSSASVAENQPAGTLVGLLSGSDQDPLDTLAFAFATGPGDADNARFQIAGGMLQTAAALDFETRSSYAIRVRVSDGRGGTLERQLTIAVTDANDAPTAIALAPSRVETGQPAGTTVGTLTATDEDRPPDTLQLALVAGAGDADNGAFQISGSTLRTAAVLDRAAGTTRAIRVGVSDGRGGTFEQQLTVSVDTVNHAPTDLVLTPSTVAENQPAETVVGALSATDADPGDTLTFGLVAGEGSADNGAFRIAGDSLRTSAPLDFETKSSYAIRLAVSDGRATSERALTVTVTDANDAPVAGDDSFGAQTRAVGNTSLVGDDPSDGAPDPTGPQKTVAGDILANDADEDGTGSLAVIAGTLPTNDGGSVDLQSDGDFVFHPAAGTSCADHSDFFDYTVTDQNTTKPPATPGTDVGRVTIEIQDCVWYVDGSAASGGDGTSGAPFSTLAGLAGTAGAGDADASGDTIFLYGGTYAGGLALEPAQSLFGQRHGLTVPNGGGGAAVTLEPAVPGLVAPSTIAGGLVLAADDTIQGIDLGDAPDVALSGTAVGNAVMNTVTPGAIDNRTGGAVAISGGTLTMAFSSVTSSGGTSGIALTNVAGSFTAAGGTLAGAAGDDVLLSGGSADVTYGGAIADDVGPLVTISNETAGTKDFNGAVSDGDDGDGGGIALANNTGATIRFRGGVTLATGANPAFSATGGGTLAVTDPAGPAANTVATTTGTAVEIADTRIRAGGVTFERVSSSGAPSGIVLNGTGNLGAFAVTGGGAAGSGGTIAGSTGPGISLTGVSGGADLAWMSVTGGGDDGIRGANVDGFRFANGAVTNNGDAAGESGMDLTALTGAVTVAGATATGNAAANVSIEHNGGTLDATVSGGTFGGNSPTLGTDGILLRGIGGGTMTANVQDATFTNNRRDHVRMTTDATSTVVQHLTVNNATMTSDLASVAGGGIKVTPGGTATSDATLTSNSIQGAAGTAIVVDSGGTAAAPQPVSIAATISQNTIGTPGTADSGSRTGDGIAVNSNGGASVRALVANNRVSQYANAAGINLAMRDANSTLDATVRGNTISNPGTAASNGVLLRSGSMGGTETTSSCLDLGDPGNAALKNALTGAGTGGLPANTDIRVRQLSGTTIKLPGYTGGPGANAAVVAYLQGRNDPVAPPTASATGNGFVGAASCVLP